jgi:hypothetical protein
MQNIRPILLFLLMTLASIGGKQLAAQDLVDYQLNNGYQFSGYVKANSLGAIGIFYRSHKIWVVRILYHPTEYGVAVEYKVPGWTPIEEYIKNKSNEVCLEYVYLELMKRLQLPPEKGLLKTRFQKALHHKTVQFLLKKNNTKVLWAYTHMVDFRISDGSTGSFPTKMFIGTKHEKNITNAYIKEATAVIAKQIELAGNEFMAASLLRNRLFAELPLGAFGPTWLGLSPDSPRTWQLMKVQQNASYLFNQSARRQRYLFILKNAL